MHTRSKLLLAGLTAAAVLAAVVSSASANRLSTSERGFRAVWASLRFVTGIGVIECPVTLEGSFHSSILSKVRSALFGSISRASVRGALAAGSCTNGALTIVQESLPWHVQYRSFSGSLPRLSGLSLGLINARMRLDPLGALPACNLRTTTANPGVFTVNVETNGLVTGMTADESAEIPLEEGLCPFGGALSYGGTASVTRLGSTSNVAITLITSGGGEEPPRLTPSPVEFGRVEVGGLSRRTVTITAGTEALTVNSIRVSAGTYFAITDPNRCVSTRLSARATCTFRAIFVAPEEAERSVSDTITVATTVRTLEVTARGNT